MRITSFNELKKNFTPNVPYLFTDKIDETNTMLGYVSLKNGKYIFTSDKNKTVIGDEYDFQEINGEIELISDYMGLSLHFNNFQNKLRRIISNKDNEKKFIEGILPKLTGFFTLFLITKEEINDFFVFLLNDILTKYGVGDKYFIFTQKTVLLYFMNKLGVIYENFGLIDYYVKYIFSDSEGQLKLFELVKKDKIFTDRLTFNIELGKIPDDFLRESVEYYLNKDLKVFIDEIIKS